MSTHKKIATECVSAFQRVTTFLSVTLSLFVGAAILGKFSSS